MNIHLDKNTFKFSVVVEESDLGDIAKLEKLKNEDGWKIFVNALMNVQAIMVGQGLTHITSTEAGNRAASLKQARFAGFYDCAALYDTMITSAKILREKIEEERNMHGEAE